MYADRLRQSIISPATASAAAAALRRVSYSGWLMGRALQHPLSWERGARCISGMNRPNATLAKFIRAVEKPAANRRPTVEEKGIDHIAGGKDGEDGGGVRTSQMDWL